mgnify:CR=1 FL=1
MPVRHRPAMHSGREPMDTASSVMAAAKMGKILAQSMVLRRPMASKRVPVRILPRPSQTDSTPTRETANASGAFTERAKSLAKLMTELLPVLDNFQLALKSPAESQEAQNVVKGVEMIYRQMLQTLEQAGMAKIEAVGQPFNPNLHEAIMQVEDDTVPEDTVVEELRAGYMLKERVIRPSMVKVSK